MAQEGQAATPAHLDLHPYLHFQLSELIVPLTRALPKQSWNLLEKLLPDRHFPAQLGQLLVFLTEHDAAADEVITWLPGLEVAGDTAGDTSGDA